MLEITGADRLLDVQQSSSPVYSLCYQK